MSVSDSDSDLDLEEEDSIINSSLVHHNYNHQRPNQNNGSSGIDILLFASQLSSQLSSVNTGDAIASSRLPAAATATAAVCTDTISCSSCVSLNGTANTSTTTTTTTSMYQKMMTDRLTSMNNANEASKSKQSSDLLLSSANSMFVNSVLAASKKSKSTPRNNHKQAQVKIDLLEQYIRNKLMEKIQRNQLIQRHLRQCQTDDIQKYHQKYGVLYRRALLEIRSETIHQLRGQLNK